MMKVVKVIFFHLGDINLAETLDTIEKFQTMDILVYETILRESVAFMQLFALPNEKHVLLNIIKIAYNSFYLPSYVTEEEIRYSLDEAIRLGNLTEPPERIDVIPLPVDQIIVLKMIESKSEMNNGNFFSFMENLLIREISTKNNQKLDIRQIIDIYCVISQEYHDLRSNFDLIEQPLLTIKGKNFIRTQAWKELHNYWDLMYDYLAEDTVFAKLIELYFRCLEQNAIRKEFIFEGED